MSLTHADHELTAGDTWVIAGTLKDIAGAPMQLADDVTIEWALMDAARAAVLTTADVTIAVVSAALGTCTITVLPTKSLTVPPGLYNDALRISTRAGYVATMWEGPLSVKGSPFNQQAA